MQQDTIPLVRALMRRLYGIYDNGGHSSRSIRSRLLEAAFWPQPEELPEVGTHHTALIRLELEAKETGYIGLFSTHLERMNCEMFFCLALKAMLEERPEDPPQSYTEQQVIRCALVSLRAEERLILEAKRMLQFTQRPTKEIAYDLGFQDPSYFSKVFKRLARCSPLEYRRRLQAMAA